MGEVSCNSSLKTQKMPQSPETDMSSHTYPRHHPDMKESPAKNYGGAFATVRMTEKLSSETLQCFSGTALGIEEML